MNPFVSCCNEGGSSIQRKGGRLEETGREEEGYGELDGRGSFRERGGGVLVRYDGRRGSEERKGRVRERILRGKKTGVI